MILLIRVKHLFVAFALLIILQSANAQQSLLDNFIKDDPIVEMLDSLAKLKIFDNSKFIADRNKLNIYKYPIDSVPRFDPQTYQKRLALLSSRSPIKFDYNATVHNVIEFYAIKRRNTVSKVLGLAQLYFPVFEEQLAIHDMPQELKYLAIVESALNPIARSRAGAQGIWQFMYTTGKMYGLHVTSYTDDRNDVVKSTIAACKYLKHLYEIYNDWYLALAAYNSGPGNINKAIRRSGGKTNFWEIAKYLPRETAGYVPAFIAATYIMNYATEHNIFPQRPKYYFTDLDTLHITRPLKFEQISAFLNTPIEDLQFLNPIYVRGVIPVMDGKPSVLYLPRHLVGNYINNEANIYAHNPLPETEEKAYKVEEEVNFYQTTERKYHYVRNKETITKIANRYRVKVSDIIKWNNLKTTKLKKGQKIIVYVSQKKVIQKPKPLKENIDTKTEENKTDINPNKVETPKANIIYHSVKKGESLQTIAKQYNNVTVNDLLEWNNLTMKSKLKIGQKLKIHSK